MRFEEALLGVVERQDLSGSLLLLLLLLLVLVLLVLLHQKCHRHHQH